MKKTIISLGIVALNLCTSFTLPISAQTTDSSKTIEINGFTFKLIGCQLNHNRDIGVGLSAPGIWCDIEIKNKQNSPRILRYKNSGNRGSSHFADSSGYLHGFNYCSGVFKHSRCQSTFKANESKVLSTGAGLTAIKKNDFINTIVLAFDLLEASGSKSFEAIFNKSNTGKISVTSDAPIVYGKNAIAQEDAIQQEMKVKGLKFQLLYCRNLGEDIESGVDGIEEGVCEFKVTNTSDTVIELENGYEDYRNAIDIEGNKHSVVKVGLNRKVSLYYNYRDGRYFVESPNFKELRFGGLGSNDGATIYPGVTVKGHIIIKNIFPGNTAFRKLNLSFIIQGKKGGEVSVVFGTKNIPILPAK